MSGSNVSDLAEEHSDTVQDLSFRSKSLTRENCGAVSPAFHEIYELRHSVDVRINEPCGCIDATNACHICAFSAAGIMPLSPMDDVSF